MDGNATSNIDSINLLDKQIRFRYEVDTNNQEIAVKYQVYFSDGEPANETPIVFLIKKNNKDWETGEYVNGQFVPEADIISNELADAIILKDNIFSKEDKLRRWQQFSLETAHGKFRFAEEINGYRVVYKLRIGFLQNSDELVQDEEFIITKIGNDWVTCKIMSENGREIISSLVINEIKDLILRGHNP